MFVDLEKTFDEVPREVIHLTLRQKGAPEYFIRVVKLLLQSGIIRWFFCESSCLSWASFESIICHCMNFLTVDVRDTSLVELLYAYDLDLCRESLDEVMGKYKRWKTVL